MIPNRMAKNYWLIVCLPWILVDTSTFNILSMVEDQKTYDRMGQCSNLSETLELKGTTPL